MRSDFSSCRSDLSAVDGVARVTKIEDADEPVASPVQQHEVSWRSRGIAGIAYQDRWPSVDESRNEQPIVRQRVIAEIFTDRALAIHTGLVDQFEPHFVGEHVADRVEIAGVEAVDVGSQ